MSSAVVPFFLVGLPRSGSTLWTRIVDKDDDVFCFGEMHFLSVWRYDFRSFRKQYAGDLSQDANLERLVDALFDREKTQRLKGNFWKQILRVDPQQLQVNILERLRTSPRNDGDIFRALIEEACLIRGYQRCMVKFPVYITQIKTLRGWYPHKPIVHITRDPRAIAASKTNDPGGTRKLLQRWPWLKVPIRFGAELFVVMQYNLASRVHTKMRDTQYYRLFYYEDLVADPQVTLTELCRFADLNWSDQMLSPEAGEASSITAQRRGGIDRRSTMGWMKALSPGEVNLITRLTRTGRNHYQFDPAIHPVYQGATTSGEHEKID